MSAEDIDFLSEILSGVGQIYLSDKKHEQKQCIKENYLSLSKIAYTELSERINPILQNLFNGQKILLKTGVIEIFKNARNASTKKELFNTKKAF